MIVKGQRGAPLRAQVDRAAQAARGAILAGLAALAAGGLGCAVNRYPVKLPPAEKPYVAVLSGEMPEPIRMVARHAWILANPGRGEPLLRYEYTGRGRREATTSPFAHFAPGDIAIHGILEPDEARMKEILACFDAETPRYNEEHPGYFPIPGPNSNTYVDRVLRRCGVHVELPATAIGKDYLGPAGVSVTTGGTGVQLSTWVFGVKLGVTEGVEIHVFGLAVGIDLWPPAIIVPVNPGRIGFDDR
jgi:hypothetical protein